METAIQNLNENPEISLTLKQHKRGNSYHLNPTVGRPNPPGIIQYRVSENTIIGQNIDELKLNLKASQEIIDRYEEEMEIKG